MTQTGIRRWYLVHKWTSLICTAFMLLLCVTGLPLIFHEELEDALGHAAPLPTVAAGTPAASLDSIVAKVLASRPGEIPLYLAFDEDSPRVFVTTGPTADTPALKMHLQPVDRRTGQLVPPPPQNEGFLFWMEEAHFRLFLGLPGTLFLGAMGVLFLVAIVSGVVVYAPFMRRLDFGTLRKSRSTRLKWLDMHNLLGIVITAWLLVVGFTGVFNTLNDPLAGWWQSTQLADMTAAYRHSPPPRRLGSLDVAVAAAERSAPDMKPLTIAFPGTAFSSPHHYNVFLIGNTPLTSKLLKPALIDAQTGRLTDTRDMPLIIRALFLSRPLHFGDYGGLLLKIIWALLDLVAIVVLGSGIYLWLGRRRAPIEKRLVELVSGAEA